MTTTSPSTQDTVAILTGSIQTTAGRRVVTFTVRQAAGWYLVEDATGILQFRRRTVAALDRWVATHTGWDITSVVR